jgi:hypothetical protein
MCLGIRISAVIIGVAFMNVPKAESGLILLRPALRVTGRGSWKKSSDILKRPAYIITGVAKARSTTGMTEGPMWIC